MEYTKKDLEKKVSEYTEKIAENKVELLLIDVEEENYNSLTEEQKSLNRQLILEYKTQNKLMQSFIKDAEILIELLNGNY